MLLQGVSELLLQERDLLGQFSLRALKPLLLTQALSADKSCSNAMLAVHACLLSACTRACWLADQAHGIITCRCFAAWTWPSRASVSSTFFSSRLLASVRFSSRLAWAAGKHNFKQLQVY
jgi:hypothetical protein